MPVQVAVAVAAIPKDATPDIVPEAAAVNSPLECRVTLAVPSRIPLPVTLPTVLRASVADPDMDPAGAGSPEPNHSPNH